MKYHKRHNTTVIRRSCVNDKPVWIYMGASEDAARIAYWRACKHEVKRIKNWGKIVARRMKNISRLLTNCTAAMPMMQVMTRQQEDTIKQLQSIDKDKFVCQRDFFDHIMEERRRRQDRLKNSQKEKEINNSSYDK